MSVKWYGNRLQKMLDGAEEQILRKAAMQCVAHAKVNIVQNDQIDTGFMLNSGYMATKGQDTYGQITGQGDKAPKRTPLKHMAIVAFAANYAIFQEMKRSFLYKALEQTAKDLPEIIEANRIND